jgi:prepilin-type N-terminal cleavage/methylation domain-containing protein
MSGMEVAQQKHHRFWRLWRHERGFTVIEVLVTIMIMGIVFAIASSTWFGVIESRRVDSATNQMVSELRRAHTSATNRLEDWKVDPQVNSGNYRIGPCADDPCAVPLPLASERSLEEGTQFRPAVVKVVFEPNGEAQITGVGNIQIAADDGSPCHEIEVNSVTSRIMAINNVC